MMNIAHRHGIFSCVALLVSLCGVLSYLQQQQALKSTSFGSSLRGGVGVHAFSKKTVPHEFRPAKPIAPAAKEILQSKHGSKGQQQQGQQNKKVFVPFDDSVNDLERRVIVKYGQSAYKNFIFEAEDLDSDADLDDVDDNDRVNGKRPGNFRMKSAPVGFTPRAGGSEDSKNANDEFGVVKDDGRKKMSLMERYQNSKVRRGGGSDEGASQQVAVDVDRDNRGRIKVISADDELDEIDQLINTAATPPPVPTPLTSSSASSSNNAAVTSGSSDVVTAGFRFRPPPVSTTPAATAVVKPAPKPAAHVKKPVATPVLRTVGDDKFSPFDFDDGGSSKSNSESVDSVFSATGFEELLPKNSRYEAILQNLATMGAITATKVQEMALAAMLGPSGGGDFAVLQAQTGSGKTLAFLLPLAKVVDPNVKKVQAIVLAPSRELVAQIELVAKRLFAGTGIGVTAIIGGANVRNQVKRLRDDKPQVVIATPGRLAELVFGMEKLRLSAVRAIVVDEIDHMLEEPFVGELQTIVEATPVFHRQRRPSPVPVAPVANGGDFVDEVLSDGDGDDDDDSSTTNAEGTDAQRLVCLASATGNDHRVKAFADRIYSGQWQTIAVGKGQILPTTITHGLISTPRMRALEQLRRFLNSKPTVKSALIFVNDPHRVEVICEKLLEMGMIAAPLHGDSSKDDRKEVFSRLRDGRINLVVTTELAARGIDIPEITHVINFELPTDAQHYVHRAGRCGRVGRQGLVMNFANPDTKFVIRRFGKQLGIKIQDCELREGRVYLKSSK